MSESNETVGEEVATEPGGDLAKAKSTGAATATDEDGSWDDADGDDAENDLDDPDPDTSEADADDAERKSGGRKRQRRRRKRLEPQDERAAQALEFLTEVVDHMEMDCDVSLQEGDDPESSDIHLEISGRDAGRIIGKKGQVLSALQFLVNRVVNRPGLERRYVSVDAEGYRSRRDNSLATMARRLGKQAVSDGKIITFEPMNPRDRRVVHLALAKFEGVVTKSEGEGADRRVQIIPVRR